MQPITLAAILIKQIYQHMACIKIMELSHQNIVRKGIKAPFQVQILA